MILRQFLEFLGQTTNYYKFHTNKFKKNQRIAILPHPFFHLQFSFHVQTIKWQRIKKFRTLNTRFQVHGQSFIVQGQSQAKLVKYGVTT